MPLGVALPPDSSRLQCKTTLSASRIYPALNYTDGRARVDEGSSVVGRFTGLLSSHPILITSNALYLCSRIVVAATTEIASRFDQRRHIYFGFRRSLHPPLVAAGLTLSRVLEEDFFANGSNGWAAW